MTNQTPPPDDGDDKCVDHLSAEQCGPMSPENQPPPDEGEPLCVPPNMAPEPGTCLAPPEACLMAPIDGYDECLTTPIMPGPSDLMIDCSIPENNDGQVIYWTVPGREETIGMSSCGDMGAEPNAWVDGPFTQRNAEAVIVVGLLMLIVLIAMIGRKAR